MFFCLFFTLCNSNKEKAYQYNIIYLYIARYLSINILSWVSYIVFFFFSLSLFYSFFIDIRTNPRRMLSNLLPPNRTSTKRNERTVTLYIVFVRFWRIIYKKNWIFSICFPFCCSNPNLILFKLCFILLVIFVTCFISKYVACRWYYMKKKKITIGPRVIWVQ